MNCEFSSELSRILSFWLRMQDCEHGGYYGRMRGDGTLVPDAPKGGILNARILWSFSAAYRLTRQPEYLRAAIRAEEYIMRYFVDREYGGTYWEVDCLGRPVDRHKHFYAQAFMLYGLTEFLLATRDECGMEEMNEEAGRLVVSLYELIERYGHDPLYGGYIEACTEDWGVMEDMCLSAVDDNQPKSQNTHLHILEAYTNLIRCLNECPALQAFFSMASLRHPVEAQRELIGLFCDHILNADTMHLDLFFTMDWGRAGHQRESYGHDIECSWLIHEAVLVLRDEALLQRVQPIVRAVARAAEAGLNNDGSMTHEANLDTHYREPDRHWWVQAETVVGYYNIYKHWADEQALEHALGCWHYIKTHLLDDCHGEWYWSCDEWGNPNVHDDLAGFWKCPYHNSRMCIEMIRRTREQ